MVNIIAILFLVGSLIGYILQSKDKLQFVKNLHYYLMAIGLLLIVEPSFDDGTESIINLPMVFIIILSTAFLIAELTKKKTQMLIAFTPLLLVGSLFLFKIPSTFEYFGNSRDKTSNIFLFALLGAITPVLIHLAKLGIGNLIIRFGNLSWQEEQENQLEGIIAYAFIGGICLLSNMFLGTFGILIAAIFYTISVMISQHKIGLNSIISFSTAGSLILISFLFYFLNLGNFNTFDLARGEVLEGVFLAGFIVLLHRMMNTFANYSEGKWNMIFITKMLTIPVFVSALVLFMASQKENLGGILSFCGIIAGLAVLEIISALFTNRISNPIHLSVIGIGLLVAPHFIPVQIKSTSDLSIVQKDPAVPVEDQPGESLETVKGKWKINNEKSTLSFELGPDKSRTQGKFKTISGYINIPTTIEKTEFYVKIPVASLTTFMEMRDEHLMEKEYLNEAKFGQIKFESEGITAKGDQYEAKGVLKMMGIEKEVNFDFKVLGSSKIEEKEIMILSGSSSLNRTDFGMSSDETIGNIVDFKFEVQFEK